MLCALTLLPGTTDAGSLDLRFENLRSAKGVIRICLTTNADAFPDCSGDKTALSRTIEARTPHIMFPGLPAGTYAVSAIHDENGNGRLDSFAGIPREGIGFSRNPALRFGPPRFASAGFVMAEAPAVQTVKMKYFL